MLNGSTCPRTRSDARSAASPTGRYRIREADLEAFLVEAEPRHEPLRTPGYLVVEKHLETVEPFERADPRE
jgi:hypothetical protein